MILSRYNDVNSNALGKNKVLSKSKETEKVILNSESAHIKESILHNSLNYHKIASKIKAPTFYSPVEVLRTAARIHNSTLYTCV